MRCLFEFFSGQVDYLLKEKAMRRVSLVIKHDREMHN